jgi:hypothetical protein
MNGAEALVRFLQAENVEGYSLCFIRTGPSYIRTN